MYVCMCMCIHIYIYICVYIYIYTLYYTIERGSAAGNPSRGLDYNAQTAQECARPRV